MSGVQFRKVAIVGAGAIGGWIGVHLARAGAQLSALARGETLAALQKNGLQLHQGGELHTATVIASNDATALGVQDLVVIAVKAPALVSVAQQISPLIGPDTVVLTAMNGVPWWFCQQVPGLAPLHLPSVDPDGHIARAIAPERVVGCVVHASTALEAPGVVRHQMGQGLIVGEPVGGTSERVAALAQLLGHAGFDVTASPHIRRDIWYKLWGNMTMNPVSALTGATVDRVLADPLVRHFCSAAMAEAATVGARIGCPIDQTTDDRHALTERLGAFRTSMLQDVDAGRPLELDALVGAVRDIASQIGVPTPHIDALFGLTRLFARTHGLYPAD